MEQMGLGWKSVRQRRRPDTINSGLEVTWTYHPTRWDNEFFHILFSYEWELFESPAGAKQWRPKNGGGSDMVPEAFGDGKREPRMLTSDIALRFDPIYGKISKHFLEHPDAFAAAFAKAWFKLTHRDMGPVSRYVGSPRCQQKSCSGRTRCPGGRRRSGLTDADVAAIKQQIADTGLTISQLVSTAWASAASFRKSDKRGGANGARIRLEPQRSWDVNNPGELATVLRTLEDLHASLDGKISLADLIVLAGGVGIEQAARAAGFDFTCRSRPGRTDATQEQTDVESFAFLEPHADGFRNWIGKAGARLPAEYLLLDRANQLNLSAPEMTVLVGGLRVLGANTGGSTAGVLTDRVGELTNDFFVNLRHRHLWKRIGEDGPSRRHLRRHQRREVDRHACRSGLRFQRRTPRSRRGLRE
jgi:catalase-peroxidase